MVLVLRPRRCVRRGRFCVWGRRVGSRAGPGVGGQWVGMWAMPMRLRKTQ